MPRNAWRGLDHRTHGRRRALHGRAERLLEPGNPIPGVVDLGEIVQPRGLLRRVLEPHRLDPSPVLLRP